MTLSRTLTGLLILIGLALFCYAVPTFYVELRDHCIGQECAAYYDKPPTMEWLTERGLTPSHFAAAYTSLYSLFGLCYIAAGLVIFSKRSSGFAGQVASVALVLQGLTFDSLSLALEGIHPTLDYLLHFVNAIAFIALILLFFIFPNGRFEPRWTRWLLAGILIPGLLKTAFPDTVFDMASWSPPLYIVWVMIWMVSIIAVQIYRYRRALGAIEKQQTKWAVFGMASAIAILMTVTVFYIAQGDKLQDDPLLLFAMETALSLGMLLIPVTLLFALLRRRLWDIDPIVNRTLVYGALSLFVVAVYVFVVWYIGGVFHSAGQWQWLNSLVATGLVAVLFAPLKEKLQRWINRLMYGENDDPLTVLGRLGTSLENPLSPSDALNVVTRTVREALKLPYAGIELSPDDNGEPLTVAEDGTRQAGADVSFALVHRGEPIGRLVVAPRSPGEPFSTSDRRLLDMMVRHASAVVQSAKASLELKRAAADLRESRERLVVAREEERRRLRRNLHDDLAPRLAALAYTASAAESLLDSDPGKSKAILVELQSVIRSTVTDIRRLVHDLRPPALDELGLIGAIEERIGDLSRPLPASSGVDAAMKPTALQFRLHAPEALPALPAAVEVAAFRIVTEAIVNVVRHAAASSCEVRILYPAPQGDGLALEVIDDGRGIGDRSYSSGEPGGIGLPSMRERAEELGGFVRLERLGPNGTRVRAYLPVALHQEGSESA